LDNALEQLGELFQKHDSSPQEPTMNQEFTLRGREGLCTSCEADGQIYKAVNFTDNEYVGVLDKVRLPSVKGLNTSDKIFAFDEYRLGKGTKPFRWGGILCDKWFTNMCLKNTSSRKNLWTAKKVDRWTKWIVPGSHAIDIGANVGDTTIEMAIRAKRTVAFEANPRAGIHCQTHALLNPQLDITVHPVAVAPDDGTMTLNVDCGGCNSGPVASQEWTGTNKIRVPQKRLDTFLLKEHGEDFLKKVTFIKIDTEGFDKTLLRAYKPLLNISKPTFWVEWFQPYWNRGKVVSAGSKDLFAAIHEIGYVPMNPETMTVVTDPRSSHGMDDLLLLPAEKVALYECKHDCNYDYRSPKLITLGVRRVQRANSSSHPNKPILRHQRKAKRRK